MEIFVMNAAARVDGMLGKILSTLNEKKFFLRFEGLF